MRILILGGTTEASSLVRALSGDERFAPILSLAGRTRNPVLPPIPFRIGGFGGADGLARYMREEQIEALIDATHPFAAKISANAVLAARAAGLPLLAVRRPEWAPGPQDHWTMLPDLSAAAVALGTSPRHVLLTVGRLELGPFRDHPWHRYVVRSVDAPEEALLPPGCIVIAARGPFDAMDERRLLLEHKIDVVVTKNSGGTATSAKLAAAREIGIEVIMVRRPPPSGADEADSIEDVLHWLGAHHDTLHSARRGV